MRRLGMDTADARLLQTPWLAPYAPWLAALNGLAPAERLAQLDRFAADRSIRTALGKPVRFVATGAESARGGGEPPAGMPRAVEADPALLAYEARIAQTGEVPTRVEGRGALHDLYNALVWLRFPLAKARVNALQAERINRDGVGARRGAQRDALTLLDENGLLWVCDDPGLTERLRGFDWQSLFVAHRAAVSRSVSVAVFGHGLLEKLGQPFKSITAHALPLMLSREAGDARVDAALAARLGAAPPDPAEFCPLPVMGLPGWCDDNTNPAFYADRRVFRPGRERSRHRHSTGGEA